MPAIGRLNAIAYCPPLPILPADDAQRSYVARFHQDPCHDSVWDEYAVSYDRILPKMPYYQEVLARHEAAMTATDIRRVLDCGAGTGNITERLLRAGRCVTAVDNSRAMLDKLRAKIDEDADAEERLTLVEQSAECLPQFGDGTFDGVNILLALFDMERPHAALDEAIRVLRSGGRIVVTEPRERFQMKPILDFIERHLRTLGVYEEHAADVARVFHANQVIDPASRADTERLRAEGIQQILASRGFRGVSFEPSHFGYCATIQGAKP